MIIINTLENVKKVENQTSDSKQLISNLRVFNSSISHEIKAPIRAIDGYARIFIEDYSNQIDENGLALVRNIRNICSDTLTLINKLLDYTKFAEVEPIKEPVDLENLIRSVFNELLVGYSLNNQLELHFEEMIPSILSDRFLMKQVITNIISNSLKFTRDKEQVHITAGYHYEDKTHVFYIKDNGVGFDMKFSKNLFGMFQRMHSIDDFEGSGLGLAIVKKIIQQLGGNVWITGEVGKGACTYFSIPQRDILN